MACTFLAIINIHLFHKMDYWNVVVQESARDQDQRQLEELDATLAYAQFGIFQEIASLQMQHYLKALLLEEFEVEKKLYERQGCKVMLVKNKQNQQLSIAKTTQIPENNSSASIHLAYQIQFHKKMNQNVNSHLVQIQNIFQRKNKCIRMMEYACRGDITYYIASTSIFNTKSQKIKHILTVKNILWQVVKGLEEIHNLGYVYRDLKPDNILITHDGKVKLCDFGLVAPIGVIDSSLCGTPQYMSPERLSNKRNTTPVNIAIDLWALGVLAFQLMMGYTPYQYDDKDIDGLVENIYEGYMSFDPSLPNECRHFVFNLLQTNPNKRMSLDKVKEHLFFKDFQQYSLEGSGCKCYTRKFRS